MLGSVFLEGPMGHWCPPVRTFAAWLYGVGSALQGQSFPLVFVSTASAPLPVSLELEPLGVSPLAGCVASGKAFLSSGWALVSCVPLSQRFFPTLGDAVRVVAW